MDLSTHGKRIDHDDLEEPLFSTPRDWSPITGFFVVFENLNKIKRFLLRSTVPASDRDDNPSAG